MHVKEKIPLSNSVKLQNTLNTKHNNLYSKILKDKVILNFDILI